MTDHLRRSISSGNGLSQNMPQGMAEAPDPTTANGADSSDRQPDLALDSQALQILDSSDDCIKVLDLEGRILFMSRGGQLLLGIEDITPFLNTSWIEFWQGEDRQAAVEAIAQARAGEVCTFQGYCPTSGGEPKWWDSKVSPIRGINGQVERLLCISRDITERRQIEDDRKQAEERYQTIINQAVTGVACTDLDGNLTLVNQTYCDITGYSADELRQRRMQDMTHPEDLPRNVELFYRMRTEGTPFEIEKRYIRKDGSIVWVNNSVSVIRDRDGNPQSAVAIVLDITNRKRAEETLRESEEQQAFLLKFSDALRAEPDADAVANRALRMLSEQMHLDRCYIGVYRLADDRGDFTHQVGNDRVPPLPDGVRLSDFPEALKVAFARTLVIDDVAEMEGLSDTDRQNLGALGLRALVAATLREGENNPLWAIVAISASPRCWARGEVALLEEATERTWVAMERARTESALRASEAKYRSLFTSIDEGFNLLEMIPDESGHPTDFRIVETNPAWEQQTGLTDATGKTLLEIAPNFEQQWLEFYSDVVISGRGRRTEYYTASVDRWFTVYASRIGAEGSHQVAVVFNDITDRKQRELSTALLDEIGKELSVLSAPDEIMQMVGKRLYEFLELSGCYFVDVDEAKNEVTVHYGWGSEQLPSLMQTFKLEDYLSEDFIHTMRAGEVFLMRDTVQDERAEAKNYARLNVASFVTVPFLRNGRYIGHIAVTSEKPRDWQPQEIELLREIASRIFPRIERARVEAALCESEEKYRSLFESMDEGFCLIEVLFDEGGQAFDYRFLEANPAFEKHTGLVDAIGKTIRELAPQHEAHWFEIYGRIARTGVPERFENAAQVLGRFYDVYAFRTGEPHEHKVAVLFNDISERKRVEDERKQAEAAIAADLRDTQLLRELSARLATEENIQALYQEIMAAAIALTHADAGTVQILDETTQDLVMIATQSVDQKMAEHFHRVKASSNTSCGIALRSGVRSFTDFDVPASEDPDGSMRLHVEGGLLSAQSTPLISRSGKPIGMVSTHWQTRHRPSDRELRFLDLLARQAADLIEQRQDEALRKQLLEREQAAREEAERANRIKDEFLAVLSHELRSPLNPILGWSKLLQGGKLDETKTAQALATIERNAKLQSELIEDLLDVSRILQGKLSLNVAPVNLAATIRGAIETVRLAAEAKSIQFEATLAPDVGQIWGDSTRLQQVVWNLLSNAVKFTSPGGQVNIRLEHVDSFAQITVSDTGQGIAPEFLPYVFDYFRQADGATTRKFGGLGLGLAIVRHLVELHGGTVKADSLGERQGATFTIRLPLLHTPLPANQDGRSPQQSLDLSNIKILVVDDEPDTRDLVAFVLEQQGAQVTAATSAHEALLVLPQVKPDVLLSDIGMPEMDGYMLIQQVRALTPDQGGQIPAIAFTAYAGDTNQQQVMAAGFQKYISKPIEPEVLVQTIVHLIHPN
ncbi:PAS domain S-box protein [Leptolyngbya ohadii]|uniref:PAS domain S-box protein n=1 Tax=Leptolyngbya ohadii TaxID=1962290 RepID=UPI000B59F4B4|nr:PAS domain S-box protein [Leptolyngbya ohadii]